MPIQKVLVVDDSPTELANIRSILSDSGLQVVSAASGEEAVNMARMERPDLIFMDIVMPGMDGFAACREISHDTTTRDIPVVFVSVKNQKADRLWAQMQGGRGFISKPFVADDIIEQLKAFQ